MGDRFFKAKIVSAGCDWLTVTFKPDAPQVRPLELLVQSVQDEATQRGEEVKMISPQGYSGMSVQGLFFGGREDGYMLRCSGDLADSFYRELVALGGTYNITRIDFQVTAKRRPQDRNFVERLRKTITAASQAAGRVRPPVFGCVENSERGDSLTIGSRTAERFIRVYDKSLEQHGKIEPDLLRWEVEYKGDLAQNGWSMLCNAASSMWLAISLVSGELQALGVFEDWMKDTAPIRIKTTHNYSTNERRLDWLQNHVRLTVKRLVEDGLQSEVIQALGLGEESQAAGAGIAEPFNPPSQLSFGGDETKEVNEICVR
jgi:hypothetical protein